MSAGYPAVDVRTESDWPERVRSVLVGNRKVVLQNYDPTEANNFKVIQLAMQERLLVRIERGCFILEKRP